MEYLVKIDLSPYRGRVRGDATAPAAKAVELANQLGRAYIKFPPCGSGSQVILIVRAGFNTDFGHQQILDEAIAMPGVYAEVSVDVSA